MDVEKTIQFMLGHQAKFDAVLGQLADAQTRQQKSIDQLIDIVRQVVGAVQQTDEKAEEARRRAEEARRLAEESKRLTEEAERRLDEKIGITTENLNALVKVVDELIRRDGHPPRQ